MNLGWWSIVVFPDLSAGIWRSCVRSINSGGADRNPRRRAGGGRIVPALLAEEGFALY